MNDAAKSPSSHKPRQMTLGRRLLFRIATPIIVGLIRLAWWTFRIRLDEDPMVTERAERNEDGAGEPVALDASRRKEGQRREQRDQRPRGQIVERPEAEAGRPAFASAEHGGQ